MTPDIWADYNQIDEHGRVVAYLEDIVRPDRVVVGGAVVVADPEAKAHTAIITGISGAGVLSLDVDWSSQPTPAPAGSSTTA